MYTYTLPNGIELNQERIIEAILSESEYPSLYLDTQTGALIEVPSLESLVQWISEIGKSERYYLIEHFNDDERSLIAKDFIDTLLTDLSPKHVKGARNALARGGWQAFEDFLIDKTDGWIHGWDQYCYDEAVDFMHGWLTTNPTFQITARFEGCGNCAVCKAMARDEKLDAKRLPALFQTEEIMGHVQRQMEDRAKKKDPRLSATVTPQRATPANTRSSRQKTRRTAANAAVTERAEVDTVMVFKITLNYTKPSIWRRIVVPADYTFYDLHCAIQDAMGWADAHLHAFRINPGSKKLSSGRSKSEPVTIALPAPEGDDWGGFDDLDERREKIADWFGKITRQCVYDYDFGDSWGHTVLFEKSLPRAPGATYPQCLGGKNACPPEDCGGIVGYEYLKEILANPRHKEHKDTLEWLGLEQAEEFEPTYFDPSEVVFCDPKEVLREYEQLSGTKPLP